MKPGKGLSFAVAMLIFMLAEIAIMVDVEFDFASEWVFALFIGFALLTVVQLIGIVLVLQGRYRVGGICQILASGVHALDLIGVLGIIGGVRAYQYHRHAMKAADTAPS